MFWYVFCSRTSILFAHIPVYSSQVHTMINFIFLCSAYKYLHNLCVNTYVLFAYIHVYCLHTFLYYYPDLKQNIFETNCVSNKTYLKNIFKTKCI